MAGAAAFTTGPVGLQFGLLAAPLGRLDDAATHLGDVADRCDRLGTCSWRASRAERVRVLAARDHPTAARLTGQATTCSGATGMCGRSPRCRIASRVTPVPAPTPAG